MKKATWLKELIIVWAVILGFYGMQGEAAGQGLGNIASVDGVTFDANAYHPIQDYNGQCVTYVKNARPELNFRFGDGYEGKHITDLRIQNAKSAGFEVNSIPRVGAAFLENVPTAKGGFVAHTGIVTSVELSEKDGKYVYIVNVKESNRRNDLKMGTSKVELSYPDTGWHFIHEKKDDYNAKQEEASTYINQIYKNRLGREPSDNEKKEYTEKLMSGVITAQQVDATIRSSKEYEQRVAELREEVKKSQQEARKPMVERVIDGAIKIGIEIFNLIMKAKIPTEIYIPEGFFPQELQASALNTFDKDKLTGLDQKGGQQQLTPVKVTFTQTFNGLYTQTPWAPGSQSADFSGSITSGTRTGPSEVRPGNFTGSFSGSLTAYPGDIPGTYNNQPFNAWSVISAEVKGFKEGQLKGTADISGNITVGGNTYTYTFPKAATTINTDGSLSSTFSGTIKENGVNWGTANGTLNQTKTTP